MYLFLVVCSMYAYFVLAVETDTNRQLRKKTDQELRNNGTNLKAIQRYSGTTVAVTKSIFFSSGSLGASPQLNGVYPVYKI